MTVTAPGNATQSDVFGATSARLELTPTMKLRRAPIAERYADRIEALYAA